MEFIQLVNQNKSIGSGRKNGKEEIIMNKKIVVSLGVAGVIAILLIGVVASRVGGVALRNNIVRNNYLALDVTEPLLRGVPIRIQWAGENENIEGWLQVYLRDRQGEQAIGSAPAEDGEAIVVLPCKSNDKLYSLVVRKVDNNRVVASKTVKVLPPGAECAGR